VIPTSKLAVGAVVAVPTDAGGYDPSLGWLPACIAAVPELPTPDVMGVAEDRSSFGSSVAVTLPQHLGDTREEAEELCEALAMAEPLAALLQRAAWLHDIGKAHPVFQASMHANGCGEGQWAKAPGWGSRHRRPGFRHELASALAALQLEEDPLVSYLLMAHHGKIRLQLQPYPWARDGPLHGVVEGETPPVWARAGATSARVCWQNTGPSSWPGWRQPCEKPMQGPPAAGKYLYLPDNPLSPVSKPFITRFASTPYCPRLCPLALWMWATARCVMPTAAKPW
jgi:CRISPR-associated endonuclease Cas3-HD